MHWAILHRALAWMHWYKWHWTVEYRKHVNSVVSSPISIRFPDLPWEPVDFSILPCDGLTSWPMGVCSNCWVKYSTSSPKLVCFGAFRLCCRRFVLRFGSSFAAKTSLTYQGMTSTWPLSVCIGTWHQQGCSRTFKSFLWWGGTPMDQTFLSSTSHGCSTGRGH